MSLQCFLKERGESETLEFKENFDRENVETAGTFANTKGGLILVGVSDKGLIKGIQTSAFSHRLPSIAEDLRKRPSLLMTE